eukprot:3941025-Rhodomonas_salina.2
MELNVHGGRLKEGTRDGWSEEGMHREQGEGGRDETSYSASFQPLMDFSTSTCAENEPVSE